MLLQIFLRFSSLRFHIALLGYLPFFLFLFFFFFSAITSSFHFYFSALSSSSSSSFSSYHITSNDFVYIDDLPQYPGLSSSPCGQSLTPSQSRNLLMHRPFKHPYSDLLSHAEQT